MAVSATLTQLFHMRSPAFQIIYWRCHRHTRPLAQPIRDAFNIGLLIDCEGSKTVARDAALVEDYGIVSARAWSTVTVAPYPDGNLLTIPAAFFTFPICACEAAHHTRVVFLI